MGDIRKNHTAKLKFDVAMAAHMGDKTVAEIASKYSVHPALVSRWKKQLSDSSQDLFCQKRQPSGVSEALVSQLYEEIGRLKCELDWLKKKAAKFS